VLQFQQQDNDLIYVYQHNQHYTTQQVNNDIELIMYQHIIQSPKQIVISTALLIELIIWY